MISLAASVSPTLPSKALSLKPSSLNSLNRIPLGRRPKSVNPRRFGVGKCKAELVNDAPIALAIGACVLSSLVFPASPSPDQDESDSVIDSDDARFAVMGIISFIPYFNWVSWVFAWLDTGKKRYAVYAIVYLAPYLRSNLSLSPEDSWLPIASILLCILHIQLEVSIENGDIQGLQFFSETRKYISSLTRKDDSSTYEEKITMDDHKNLPSVQRQDDKLKWTIRGKPSKDTVNLNNDSHDHTRKKR